MSSVATAGATLPTPATKTGKPAAAAWVTAITAPGESAAPAPPPRRPPVAPPQFGNPSVARRMNLGFESVRPCRYVTPASTARRVGVLDAGMVAAIALMIGPELLTAMGT